MAMNSPVILVAGFAESVHTARWINMVLGKGIQFVLVPVYEAGASREFEAVRYVSTADDLKKCSTSEVAVFDLTSVTEDEISRVQAESRYDAWRPAWLANTKMTHVAHMAAAIRRFRPVLVHSMVVQFGGYLGLATKEYLEDEFPAWLISNWGSDIFLFRMIEDHKAKLRRIASLIDAYHAECQRDFAYVQQMGFRGFKFPAIPATGGIDFDAYPTLDSFPRASERRDILIKGYHGWAGRGLHILAAIHLAADALRNYKVRITVAGAQVKATAAAVAESNGLDIVVESYLPSHAEALNRLGQCRAAIGLGISDGISTTLLEAMSVGTFPIQGSGSCGNEWIDCGRTGILVNPHDVQELANAIRRAVTDDEMVDAAAVANRITVEKRWNSRVNADIVLQNYRSLIKSPALQPARRSPDLVHG